MKLLSTVAVVASIALTTTGLAFIYATPPEAVPSDVRLEQLVGALMLQLSLVGVGGLLTWRRPGNLVGWLLLATGALSASRFFLVGYAVFGRSEWPLRGADTAAWLFSWTGLGMGLTMGWVAGVFPDGRVRSRSGRYALALIWAGSLALMLVTALRPGPLSELPLVQNPFGWDTGGAILGAVVALAVPAVLSGLILMFKHIGDRYRAALGVERQQLKWLVWSVAIVLVTMLFVLPSFVTPPDPAGSDATSRFIARVAAILAMATVPVAVAFAILRYRLYEIDILINRTLVYGAVTALLAATYFGTVVIIQALLRPFTSGSELAVAGSTLLVVALFQPLRRRVQDAVDRRFYRSRYDAARTLDAFSARLRNEVELDAVRVDLLGAVGETVQPAHASVWLRKRAR